MENNPPEVYFRRHLVLLAFCLNYLGWMLSGYRQTAIVSSYAAYHDIPNEFSAPPEFGVDSYAVVESAVTLFSYPLAGYIIDRYGLKSMIFGSFTIALAAWMQYLARTNVLLVILSKVLSGAFGPICSAALLAISNRWYPPRERAKATALGSLFAVIGAGAALLISPIFATSEEKIVDLTLKSCKLESILVLLKEQFEAAQSRNEDLLCIDDALPADEAFCCYLPVDIPLLNLVMTIAPTVAFIVTALCVRDRPPTPPAPSAEEKKYGGFWNGVKRIYSTERFTKLSITDFVVSGPPIVAFQAISRLFPPTVADYSTISAGIGIALAVPVAVGIGHILDRTKRYYSFTVAGYLVGTVFWGIATISLAVRTLATGVIFLIMVGLALCSYIAWQTAVFETKLEYSFTPETPVEGVVVAMDRMVLNLSTILFVAAIPPERLGSALRTFWVGFIIMSLGCLPTLFIKDKFKYLRIEYDTKQT